MLDKNRWDVQLLAIAAVCVIGGAFAWYKFGLQRSPRDDDLLRIFSEHKSAFEDVVAMVREDRELEFITADEAAHKYDSWPNNAGRLEKQLLPQRLDRYRELLREIGVKDMVAIWMPRRPVMFYLYSGALAAKGICYWDKDPHEESPGTVFANLDDLKKLPHQNGHVRNGVYLRPIAGNWCVFLYWKD